jgi:hypothetical protein
MTNEDVRGWFTGRLPDGWFTEAPEVTADRDEVLVVGRLAEPEGAGDDERRAARRGRIERFREETREARVRIAADFERRFGRTVSWGAACGDITLTFTTLSVPVMTRLRLADRVVLDTLVDAGVARSRSDALGWCVRLVGQHQGEWIDQLRDALVRVEKVRAEGPAA